MVDLERALLKWQEAGGTATASPAPVAATGPAYYTSLATSGASSSRAGAGTATARATAPSISTASGAGAFVASELHGMCVYETFKVRRAAGRHARAELLC